MQAKRRQKQDEYVRGRPDAVNRRLYELVEAISAIKPSPTETRLNETSITDNSGGRIKL